MTEIILTPEQEVHCNSIIQTFFVHRKVLDTSVMGTGKSIVFIEAMRRMRNNNIIMICPSDMISTWERYGIKYNVNFVRIISYESLRGKQTSMPMNLKHGLLIRNPDDTFEVTDFFRSLVEDGIVLCFDESHRMKNRNDQQKAAATLTKAIELRYTFEPYPARFCGSYFISTTQFEKQEHCLLFCNTCAAIFWSEFMIDPVTKSMEGLEQFKEYCLFIDREATNKIWGCSKISAKTANDIAYQLCIKVFLPKISHFIKSSENNNKSEDKQTIYNCYIRAPPDIEQIAELTDQMIHMSTNDTLEIDPELDNRFTELFNPETPLSQRSGITQGHMTRHTLKTKFFICPLAIKVLETIPNSKVVIFLDYLESIEVAMAELEVYGAIEITGKTKKDERTLLRERFQEPNCNVRVLVTVNQVSALGIELDDKHGGFPRVGISIASYIISNLVQAPGRIDRQLTMSKSLFFFVKFYSELNTEETVTRNIAEKSKVFREALRENGIIPPTSFYDLNDPLEQDLNELLENAGDKPRISYSEPVEEAPKIIIRRSDIKKSCL